jgi:hypothetical protein
MSSRHEFVLDPIREVPNESGPARSAGRIVGSEYVARPLGHERTEREHREPLGRSGFRIHSVQEAKRA